MGKKITEHRSIVIVGCGASGMMAAISASVCCHDILILERNQVAGKKITATGNGKCNYTNSHIEPDDFRSSDPDTAYRIYNRFDHNDTVAFFKAIGILPYERNGYFYPNSRQAASVRDALELRLKLTGCEIRYGCDVQTIRRQGTSFLINDEILCDRLILAAGGSASPVHGTDGSGFTLARALGHNITDIMPALTGLRSNSRYLKTLAGVRTEAEISLVADNKELYREYGEMIFNKDNISGIPVMNMSRIANRALRQGSHVQAVLDLIPDHSEEELRDYIAGRFNRAGVSGGVSLHNLEETLTGLLNNKLNYAILLASGTEPSFNRLKGSEACIDRFVSTAKSFKLDITGSNGFDAAQTTAGGVPLSEIDPDTMGSRVADGLYITGELLDCDGRCGGYNLQWAWTTGAIAGASAAGGSFDKSKFLKAQY